MGLHDNVLFMLVQITGNPKAIMHYERYEEEIVQRYGIELQGWTYEKIMNPSMFSSSLPPLRALQAALMEGTCKFVKLSASERKEREAAYMAKITSGEVEVRKRKRRSDAGVSKKSKRVRKDDAAASGPGSDEEAPQGLYKSQDTINDSDNDNDIE